MRKSCWCRSDEQNRGETEMSTVKVVDLSVTLSLGWFCESKSDKQNRQKWEGVCVGHDTDALSRLDKF